MTRTLSELELEWFKNEVLEPFYSDCDLELGEAEDSERLSDFQHWGPSVEGFQKGLISLDDFAHQFNSWSRGEVQSHTLGTRSGTMFLNAMRTRIPRSAGLETALRDAVKMTSDEVEAKARIRAFESFVGRCVAAYGLDKRVISPGRSAYLISLFWHIQSPDRYRIFYNTIRYVLGEMGAFPRAPKDYVAAYFTFSDECRQLEAKFNLSFYMLEDACRYKHDRDHNFQDSECCRVPRG